MRRRCRAIHRIDPKDLNPRQGITTDNEFYRLPTKLNKIPKTSIPARGLLPAYRAASASAIDRSSQRPQSPPGDYYVSLPQIMHRKKLNIPKTSLPARGLLRCGFLLRCGSSAEDPKDLNPRQGITTSTLLPLILTKEAKIPKTSIPARGLLLAEGVEHRVSSTLHPKDLNPRQGITTSFLSLLCYRLRSIPKTSIPARGLLLEICPDGYVPPAQRSQRPQSPPGDYYPRSVFVVKLL